MAVAATSLLEHVCISPYMDIDSNFLGYISIGVRS